VVSDWLTSGYVTAPWSRSGMDGDDVGRRGSALTTAAARRRPALSAALPPPSHHASRRLFTRDVIRSPWLRVM